MNSKLEALRARKQDGGFTLIEMLIVIVVLGILAGITVFGVSTFKKDSETAACKANGKTTQVAAEAFAAKTGAYPTAITDLTGTGNYMKPFDPATGPQVPSLTFSATAAPTFTCA